MKNFKTENYLKKKNLKAPTIIITSYAKTSIRISARLLDSLVIVQNQTFFEKYLRELHWQ